MSTEQSRASQASDEAFSQRLADIISQDENLANDITDSEGEDEFIKKYGEIEFQYIKPPKTSAWFIRPHALNYFKDGVLFRTKGERTSSKTELFLDLMYVAIIANVAGQASENASWRALLRYILTFIPYWTVWADIKDFTNYYYTEDLSQRFYIFWILCLLTLSVNSNGELLDSRKGAAFTVAPYILCRVSLSLSLFVYSFFIPEHRAQQRLYTVLLLVGCCIWIPVIFISTRAKIACSIVAIVFEQVAFSVVFHPRTKKFMKLSYSTALNIEHEVERFSTFVTIAIGEFLYKIAANAPLGTGFTTAYARGVFLLIVAYCLFWIYNNGGTSKKAIHPMRHSATRAIAWIYFHVPLVGAIVLAADAAGDMLNRESEYHPVEELTEEPSLKNLCFFFVGGLFVALVSIWLLGVSEKCEDHPDHFVVPKRLRILPRLFIGIIILCLGFAEMNVTLLMGMCAMLCTLLLVYESVVSVPRDQCFTTAKIAIGNETVTVAEEC